MASLNYYKYKVEEFKKEEPKPMKINILSINLQKKTNLQKYINAGYLWVRRVENKFNYITRFPTIGCLLEISNVRDIDTSLINSPKGKVMINKLCYF
jgi:hypothetical protein